MAPNPEEKALHGVRHTIYPRRVDPHVQLVELKVKGLTEAFSTCSVLGSVGHSDTPQMKRESGGLDFCGVMFTFRYLKFKLGHLEKAHKPCWVTWTLGLRSPIDTQLQKRGPVRTDDIGPDLGPGRQPGIPRSSNVKNVCLFVYNTSRTRSSFRFTSFLRSFEPKNSRPSASQVLKSALGRLRSPAPCAADCPRGGAEPGLGVAWRAWKAPAPGRRKASKGTSEMIPKFGSEKDAWFSVDLPLNQSH